MNKIMTEKNSVGRPRKRGNLTIAEYKRATYMPISLRRSTIQELERVREKIRVDGINPTWDATMLMLIKNYPLTK